MITVRNFSYMDGRCNSSKVVWWIQDATAARLYGYKMQQQQGLIIMHSTKSAWQGIQW